MGIWSLDNDAKFHAGLSWPAFEYPSLQFIVHIKTLANFRLTELYHSIGVLRGPTISMAKPST